MVVEVLSTSIPEAHLCPSSLAYGISTYLLQMDEIILLGKVRPEDPGIRGLVARHVVGLQHRPDARNIEGEGSEGATGGPRSRGRGQRREAEERRCLHDAGDGV